MKVLYLLLSGLFSGLKNRRSFNTFVSSSFNPRTENQKIYSKYLNSNNDYIISVIGPAGTGKTLFACKKAIDCLKQKTVSKIVITRPAISVEEELGFLPGNMEKKMAPWTRPLFDIFLETFSKIQLNNMMKDGTIEISPLGFMRGRTFKDSFIIADEMQNSSPSQMLMLLTRIGSNSKMVITGDLEQSDRMDNNGLKDFITRLKLHTPANFYLVVMGENDVQRSHLVNEVLNLYNSNSTRKMDIKTDYNSSILSICQNSTVSLNSTEGTLKPKIKISIYDKKAQIQNDAALIPLAHITKNFNL